MLAAEYLRLVWLTNRFTFDPVNVYEVVEPEMPFILAFWHGQHFMTPFIRKDQYRGKVLISRHRDGELNAIAAERLKIGTVRGSGDHGSAFHRKGGVGAFKEMLRALEENYNMRLRCACVAFLKASLLLEQNQQLLRDRMCIQWVGLLLRM